MPKPHQPPPRHPFVARMLLVCSSCAARMQLVCNSYSARMQLVCNSYSARVLKITQPHGAYAPAGPSTAAGKRQAQSIAGKTAIAGLLFY